MQNAWDGSSGRSRHARAAFTAVCAAALLAASPACAAHHHTAHHARHHRIAVDSAAGDTAHVQLASYEQPVTTDADTALADGDMPDTAREADQIDVDSAAPGDIMQTGTASWYGRAWKGRRTSSGARFDPEAMTAASHLLPLGTRVLVTLEGTARSVLVTITDRQGCASRVIDLSLAAARKIGMLGMGTARVILRRA